MDFDIFSYLKSRNFDINLYQNVYYDEKIMTLILHDFSGKIIGYQRHIPFAPKKTKNPKEARYFTRVTKNSSPGVWGREYDNGSNLVFIVEGVFKASCLHKLGYQAWALLTSSPSPCMMSQLKLTNKTFICIGDNDKAGKSLSNKFKRGIILDDIDEWDSNELNIYIKEHLMNMERIYDEKFY